MRTLEVAIGSSSWLIDEMLRSGRTRSLVLSRTLPRGLIAQRFALAVGVNPRLVIADDATPLLVLLRVSWCFFAHANDVPSVIFMNISMWQM